MSAESKPSAGPSRIRVPVKIEEALAAAAIGLLALITFANVVVRYATNFSFAFTEEFSVFLMLAMALIGGASAMAKGGHLSISYLVERFSPAAQRRIRIFSNAMVAATFLILVILGGQMAYDEYRFEVTSPGLGLPTWIYTVWLPILSLAILGRVLGVIVRVWRDRS
jgi:TRAP-type C4-dicarboxylate transport system permease small subunit